jgi:hypothetical protein
MRNRPILIAVLIAVLVAAALATVAAPASAFRLGLDVSPIAGNPADRLASLPADPEVYDRATHCSPRPKAGTVALIGWLQRNARGVSWGSYRCEKWGEGEASLHAENRAVDWHLDVGVPADRAAARRLIELLLATDRAGTPHALARRMGVEEIIWDCSYWGAGMDEFRAYSPCLNRHGDVRAHVNRTVAHRDHLHLGLSKAGAAKRTSFWAAG